MPNQKIDKVKSSYYSCMKCNYSKSCRTKTESRLALKLHTKVCKGTGRTDDELPHENYENQILNNNPKNSLKGEQKIKFDLVELLEHQILTKCTREQITEHCPELLEKYSVKNTYSIN